jgi:hypothetical protein
METEISMEIYKQSKYSETCNKRVFLNEILS